MKTYEEMARDVLKRRDEELQKLEALQQTDMNNAPPEVVYPAKSKKSMLLPAIAIPCAAALAIGAVTVGVRYGGLRENGGNVLPGVASESSENSAEQLANSTDNGDRSGAPEKKPSTVFDVEDRINILDNVPDHLKDHELVYNHNVMGPMVELTLTMDEFNSFYGMEADRLTRLHPDWGVIAGGNHPNYIDAYVGDDNVYSSVKLGGKPINDERYYLGYDFYDGQGYLGVGDDLWIRAIHTDIREEVFSPFDGDESKVSYINGRRAVIFRNPDRSAETKCDSIDAIIEFGDTLISMTGLDLTEEEFINILFEYTSREYDIAITPWNEVPKDRFVKLLDEHTAPVHDDLINILDEKPRHLSEDPLFQNHKPSTTRTHILSLTDDEMNSWYGFELDRLGRLHKDWRLVNDEDDIHCNFQVYGGDETDSENFGDYMLGGRKVVWELNGLAYDFKDGGYMADHDGISDGEDVFVFAEHIGVLNYMGDPFNITVCDPDIISYINNKKALIYYDGHGGNKLAANIEYGSTIVTIWGYDLSEDEFINVLDEFTSPEYDIEITPWRRVQQEKFAEIIKNIEAAVELAERAKLPEG